MEYYYLYNKTDRIKIEKKDFSDVIITKIFSDSLLEVSFLNETYYMISNEKYYNNIITYEFLFKTMLEIGVATSFEAFKKMRYSKLARLRFTCLNIINIFKLKNASLNFKLYLLWSMIRYFNKINVTLLEFYSILEV